jgi:hypothetical protein
MIEPDFGASEVRVLSPDIRLERSGCTARTGSPLSTSYLGDAGIKISGYGDTKQRRHKPVITRPSRCLEYAHLVVLRRSAGGSRALN